MPRLARFLELLIRFAAQRVALALLRADVQKTDARIFDAEHLLRVVAAKIRKLQQVFDRALGVRAAVDEYRLALGRRDGRRERRAAQAADALDNERRARKERARAARADKAVRVARVQHIEPHGEGRILLVLKGRRRGVLALRKVVDDVYADAREAKKQGKLVGWSSSKFPCELAEAFDLNVMYPENQAAAEAPAVPMFAPAKQEEPEIEQTTFVPPSAAPWRIAGEVLDTYIVCEDEDKNVWLIDKHAAHERVNFDRMKANQEPLMCQALLAPLVAEFAAEEYSALAANLELLREFGFECEEFGGGSLILRAIPADIDSGDAIPALEELADKLVTAHTVDPAAARDALLHTMACKAAIKGGWKSDLSELRVLVDKVQSGEVQFCPHGRPVKAKLTKYELEKMFKRA